MTRTTIQKPFLPNKKPRRLTFEPRRQTPYRTELKTSLARCPSCHGVSLRGHWLSEAQAKKRIAKETIIGTAGMACPACRQKKDRYAEGVVELHGTKWRKNSEMIFQTIGNTEAIERSRNDQGRVLWSRSAKDVTRIYVSLPQLARHIGRQLKRTFKGKVEYRRSSEEPYLRVVWDSDR